MGKLVNQPLAKFLDIQDPGHYYWTLLIKYASYVINNVSLLQLLPFVLRESLRVEVSILRAYGWSVVSIGENSYV